MFIAWSVDTNGGQSGRESVCRQSEREHSEPPQSRWLPPYPGTVSTHWREAPALVLQMPRCPGRARFRSCLRRGRDGPSALGVRRLWHHRVRGLECSTVVRESRREQRPTVHRGRSGWLRRRGSILAWRLACCTSVAPAPRMANARAVPRPHRDRVEDSTRCGLSIALGLCTRAP
jgi:hypothetical protein